MSCTLAMIVRNEEANLPACLASVRGLFDDTVVVDTGSTDRTVKVARSFGARVFRFPWCDDFAAARNFGLDQVRTDYFVRLDADDRLFPGHRKRLRTLLARLSPGRPEAYTAHVHSVEHDGHEAICQEFRLFPSHCRFSGRVHERVRLEDYARELAVGPSHIRIDHTGYADADTYFAKLARNYAILVEESKRPGVDSLVWCDLGRTQSALGYRDAALGSLALFLGSPREGVTAARRLAHRTILGIHRERSDLTAAIASVERALTEFPDDPTLISGLSDLLREHGHYALAAEGYERALALHCADRIDSGIPATFRAQVQAALDLSRAAIRSAPPVVAVATEPGCQSLAEILGI